MEIEFARLVVLSRFVESLTAPGNIVARQRRRESVRALPFALERKLPDDNARRTCKPRYLPPSPLRRSRRFEIGSLRQVRFRRLEILIKNVFSSSMPTIFREPLEYLVRGDERLVQAGCSSEDDERGADVVWSPRGVVEPARSSRVKLPVGFSFTTFLDRSRLVNARDAPQTHPGIVRQGLTIISFSSRRASAVPAALLRDGVTARRRLSELRYFRRELPRGELSRGIAPFPDPLAIKYIFLFRQIFISFLNNMQNYR